MRHFEGGKRGRERRWKKRERERALRTACCWFQASRILVSNGYDRPQRFDWGGLKLLLPVLLLLPSGPTTPVSRILLYFPAISRPPFQNDTRRTITLKTNSVVMLFRYTELSSKKGFKKSRSKLMDLTHWRF